MSTPIYTGRLVISGTLVLQERLFATLPGQASHGTGEAAASIGELANISDGSIGTIGVTCVGGGTHHVLVRYNGTVWVVVAGS